MLVRYIAHAMTWLKRVNRKIFLKVMFQEMWGTKWMKYTVSQPFVPTHKGKKCYRCNLSNVIWQKEVWFSLWFVTVHKQWTGILRTHFTYNILKKLYLCLNVVIPVSDGLSGRFRCLLSVRTCRSGHVAFNYGNADMPDDQNSNMTYISKHVFHSLPCFSHFCVHYKQN